MILESILKPGFEVRAGVYYYTDVYDASDLILDHDPSDKRRWTVWRTRNFEFLEREMGALPGGVLVDVGAGHSDFRELYKRFEVVPIDHCPYARIKVVSDLNKEIPLKDGSADVVMLSNVLEHIFAPGRTLLECHRILKSGGVILGAVPFLMAIHQRPHDYYRYTDICLRNLLTDAGFTSIEVVPVVSHYVLFRVSAEWLFRGLIEHYRQGTGMNRLLTLLMRVHWFAFRWIYLKRGLTRFRGGFQDAALGFHFKALR